ncbi:hypothetical protein [Compostimonas suwonensis]|nr:hypothetical protein [Compostimonas suwonensis]
MASRRGDESRDDTRTDPRSGIRSDTHYSVGMQVLVRTDSLVKQGASGNVTVTAVGVPDPGGARVPGVIVEPGGAQQGSFIAFGSNQPNTWIVAFDEPFTAPDGSGPHETAEVNEIYLLPAPSGEGDSGA